MSGGLLKFVLTTLRPLLGNVSVRFDRENQTVTIVQKGGETTLTYDQAIDEIEKLFHGEEQQQ